MCDCSCWGRNTAENLFGWTRLPKGPAATLCNTFPVAHSCCSESGHARPRLDTTCGGQISTSC